MIVDMLQTCFWNAVDRVVPTFAGAVSFAMSGIVVADGLHATDFLPVSLSVISFQRVPPHCGPGVSTRAPAGLAAAATTAASVAAAVRTIRILGPPESKRWPQRTGVFIGLQTTPPELERVTPLAGARRP